MVWIEHISQVIERDATGDVSHLLGVIRDITDQKQLADRLHSAAEEWQTTFDSISDLVMIIDKENRILRVNAAAVRFLGLPVERIVGASCCDLLHGDNAPIAGCACREACQTGQRSELETFHAGSRKWLLFSTDPIRDAAGNVTGAVHVGKDITARKCAQEELVKSYAEIKHLKEALQAENVSLRQDLQISQGSPEILGRSDAIQRVLALAARVAPTDPTVLILGETGTGQELVASAIHNQSTRRDRPMIRVNCAAIPSTLIESEIFGREKGAFTGALTKQIGRFEAADHSTIFLDEIGELPLDVQVKLLRFLQEWKIERLGSPKAISLDVRIIAATNSDLQKAIREGGFRDDLYYRLSVFPITVPPLRERRDDIPIMVREFANANHRIRWHTCRSGKLRTRYPGVRPWQWHSGELCQPQVAGQ